MGFFAIFVYSGENLRVRLATQRKFLRKLNLLLLASPFDQGFILLGNTRRTRSELPDVGTKLEAWRLKMFHNFHDLQYDMVFGL